MLYPVTAIKSMATGLYLLLAIWLRGISDDVHLGDVKTGFCQIQDVVMLQAVLGSSEALDPSDCASGPVCRTKPNSESDASAKKKRSRACCQAGSDFKGHLGIVCTETSQDATSDHSVAHLNYSLVVGQVAALHCLAYASGCRQQFPRHEKNNGHATRDTERAPSSVQS